jgi:hypothetical protein
MRRAPRQLQMLQLLVQVCTISGRDGIHAIHGWKHHQVKIPTQQMARHLDFPIRCNDHLIEGYAGAKKTRELKNTSLITPPGGLPPFQRGDFSLHLSHTHLGGLFLI